MELIDFRGLNCYYNCIVTIAAARGIDYTAAFSALWSETDFKYDPFRKVFLTKRLLADLGAAGANLVMLPAARPDETAASLALFDAGELAIVGMDAFYIPWTPLYGLHRGAHYFIAAAAPQTPICFDPTYGAKGERLERGALTAHAFDVSRLCQTSPRLPARRVADEAAAVLRVLPALRAKLGESVLCCARQTGDMAIMLARYADALLNNRLMFARRLGECHDAAQLFDRRYFKDWQAVKNGLYKLAISGGDGVKTEILARLDAVFARETACARRLLGIKDI